MTKNTIENLILNKSVGAEEVMSDLEKIARTQVKGAKATKKSNAEKEKAKKLAKEEKEAVKALNDAKKAETQNTAKYASAMRGLTKALLGVGLSFLFTGMAIKRLSMGIIRAGVSAFTEIQESAGLAGGAISELTAWFQYLKYTLGSAINRALDPYKAKIIEVLGAFATWISNHEKLVFWVLTATAAIGGLMMVFGQTVLFGVGIMALVKGFSEMKLAIEAAGAALKLSGLTAAAGGAPVAAAAATTSVIPPIAIAAALAVGAVAAYKADIADMQAYTDDTLSALDQSWETSSLAWGESYKAFIDGMTAYTEGNLPKMTALFMKSFALMFVGLISMTNAFAVAMNNAIMWMAQLMITAFIDIFVNPIINTLIRIISIVRQLADWAGNEGGVSKMNEWTKTLKGFSESMNQVPSNVGAAGRDALNSQYQQHQTIIDNFVVNMNGVNSDDPAQMAKEIYEELYKAIEENTKK